MSVWTNPSAVYQTQTIILQDVARRLPFGQGTFPLGNGSLQQEPRAYLQRWTGPAPVTEVQSKSRLPQPPNVIAAYMVGGDPRLKAPWILDGNPNYSPYSLILGPYDRLYRGLQATTPISTPPGDPTRVQVIGAWPWDAPEVWIMERSPDWSVLQSFTAPPPPPPPSSLGWAQDPHVLQMIARPIGQYVLLVEPAFNETILDTPPIGDVPNSLARTLINLWQDFTPPTLVYPRTSPLAGQQAPPRVDKPPIGENRWIAAMLTSPIYNPVREIQRFLTTPGRPPIPGDALGQQLAAFRWAAFREPYSTILEPSIRLGELVTPKAQATIGNLWWWLQMMYWISRAPDPTLPWWWFARESRMNIQPNPIVAPPVFRQRTLPPYLRRLQLLGIYPGLT